MEWRNLLSAGRQQETKTQEASRSAFEQDYDRIIFSQPFRRLQDKTQVHPLPEHDFVHTRLTHSLEVSSVGRSLGRLAGEVILQRHPELAATHSMFDFGAVTAAASLAHDLGNPPFGHAGEDALSDFFSENAVGLSFRERVSPGEWTDLAHFEGNAQGFRILSSQTSGLRLTLATLGAFTKYPCGSNAHREKGRKSLKKFGYFQSERSAFAAIATGLQMTAVDDGTWRRHPLAFLVEAADDICYNIIDLEDGCRLGLVSYGETIELLASIIGPAYNAEKLARIASPDEKIGVLRALAIQVLVKQCTDVFLAAEGDILAGRFDRALTDECAANPILTEINLTSVSRIYRSRNVLEVEAAGHEVLPGLLEEFLKAGEWLHETRDRNTRRIPRKFRNLIHLFPPGTAQTIEETETPYGMCRACLDFISGLTDKQALSLFRKIRGISLS